jgi:hypothetical protein
MGKAAAKRAKPRTGVRDLHEFVRERAFKNVDWTKVTAPQSWAPSAGDVLLGYYQGRVQKTGQFGDYEVIQVLVPSDGIYAISGAGILQLAASATLSTGDPVKIVFKGTKDLPNGHTKKLFELFIARE